MKEKYIVLHNIRSAYNVGSIFRTADAAGVLKIFGVGTTPTPIDRFGRARKDIAKVALGAEKSVGWEHYDNIEELVAELKEQNVYIVAVEQHKNAIDFQDLKQTGPTAYIFGSETSGLPDEVCHTADTVIEIPMHGKKESLNVSVSVGVVLFS